MIRPVEFRFDRGRDSPIANSETGNWLLTGWTINATRLAISEHGRVAHENVPVWARMKKTDVASDKKVRDARRAPAPAGETRSVTRAASPASPPAESNAGAHRGRAPRSWRTADPRVASPKGLIRRFRKRHEGNDFLRKKADDDVRAGPPPPPPGRLAGVFVVVLRRDASAPAAPREGPQGGADAQAHRLPNEGRTDGWWDRRGKRSRERKRVGAFVRENVPSRVANFFRAAATRRRAVPLSRFRSRGGRRKLGVAQSRA